MRLDRLENKLRTINRIAGHIRGLLKTLVVVVVMLGAIYRAFWG